MSRTKEALYRGSPEEEYDRADKGPDPEPARAGHHEPGARAPRTPRSRPSVRQSDPRRH
jgi:hypothetical protein